MASLLAAEQYYSRFVQALMRHRVRVDVPISILSSIWWRFEGCFEHLDLYKPYCHFFRILSSNFWLSWQCCYGKVLLRITDLSPQLGTLCRSRPSCWSSTCVALQSLEQTLHRASGSKRVCSACASSSTHGLIIFCQCSSICSAPSHQVVWMCLSTASSWWTSRAHYQSRSLVLG